MTIKIIDSKSSDTLITIENCFDISIFSENLNFSCKFFEKISHLSYPKSENYWFSISDESGGF